MRKLRLREKGDWSEITHSRGGGDLDSHSACVSNHHAILTYGVEGRPSLAHLGPPEQHTPRSQLCSRGAHVSLPSQDLSPLVLHGAGVGRGGGGGLGSLDSQDQVRALSTAGTGTQRFHAPAVSTCRFGLCVPGVCLPCVWAISMCVTAPWLASVCRCV